LEKKILLISYVFPPYHGIGGRRWAKHAIALSRRGYTVHVICAKNPFKKQSLWTEEVSQNPQIIVHPIPALYPRVLLEFDHSLIEKVAYRIWVLLFNLFTKGSYLDRSVFWKNSMLRTASKVIREQNIRKVVATGAPFGVLYYATLLKMKFNDLVLMSDLRDPWTWGPNWGFPTLSERRRRFEEKRERETMEMSDLVSVPSEAMQQYLQDRYPELRKKFVHLPHFFDPDEVIAEPKTPSDKCRFIIYGNIYLDSQPYLERLSEACLQYGDRISVDFYTDKQEHKKLFERTGATNVHFHDQVPARELFRKFSAYDFVLMLSPDYNRDNISTKFFEIISTRTPIFLFCNPGKGSEFITTNGLGIHASLSDFEQRLAETLEQKGKPTYNTSFQLGNYSLASVTDLLEQQLALLTRGRVHINGRKKNILITFDYELFLGDRSGSVGKCITLPTELMLASLRRLELRGAIFFVDTAYLMRLEEEAIRTPAAENDLRAVKNQLIRILQNGHYILPHLHPHWLDAVYLQDLNQWSLSDTSKYRFHFLSPEERSRLFGHSLKLISDLQQAAGVTYQLNGFRAGGWCIQPFSDYGPFFSEFGIRFDFSVLRGFSLLNRNYYYDFVNVPPCPIYKLSSAVETGDENGKFVEFSITRIHVNNFRLLLNRIILRLFKYAGVRAIGDGVAINKHDNALIIGDSMKFHSEKFEMTSIELLTMVKRPLYEKYIDDNSFIHFISHPKMLEAHNISCFEGLLARVKSNYEIETDYMRMITECVAPAKY
jgi:glycosyltransferase involved in cell wall biosynthesis